MSSAYWLTRRNTMKRIQLSDHFKVSTILLFSLPSIGMQIVDSTYQVVDG